jgi:outer membrane biosynthesis protein TonB
VKPSRSRNASSHKLPLPGVTSPDTMLHSTLLLAALSLTSSAHATHLSARDPLSIPAFPRFPKPEAQPAPPLAPAPAPRPPLAPAPVPAPRPAPPPAPKPDRKPDDPEVPDAPDDSGASSRRLNGLSTTTGSSTVRFLGGSTPMATVGSSTRTVGWCGEGGGCGDECGGMGVG